MKEHKGQILAALALSLALGLAVMPSAVFAAEESGAEGEAGVDLLALDGEGENAKDDGTGATEDKKEALGLTESIIELYNRVQERESFKGYRDAEDLVGEVVSAKKFSLVTAEYWLKHADTAVLDSSAAAGSSVFAWNVVSKATQDKMGSKLIYEVIDDLKADAAYTSNEGYKKSVDNTAALAASSVTNITKELNTLFPDDTEEIAKMDLKALVAKAETLKDFAKFVDLYESMQFLNGVTDDGEEHLVVSATKLTGRYTDAQLQLAYSLFAAAAEAIDGTVLEGLDVSWKLPQTGAPAEQKPETPNTGALDATDASALDLALVTLIAAGSLATLGGAALVAKLYLCHKF